MIQTERYGSIINPIPHILILFRNIKSITMKKIILFCFVLAAVKAVAQDKALQTKKEEDYDLFITGGVHVGVWALALQQVITSKEVPYNVHIDKLLKEKYMIGVGYTYDSYSYSPSGSTGPDQKTKRQNFRLRFCKFLSNQEKKFSTYLGVSAGVSYWDLRNKYYSGYNEYWPTAQFLFGMKVKFTDTFFWIMELGAGPPYALQTSVGIKF